jgi:hypothetical protein
VEAPGACGHGAACDGPLTLASMLGATLRRHEGGARGQPRPQGQLPAAGMRACGACSSRGWSPASVRLPGPQTRPPVCWRARDPRVWPGVRRAGRRGGRDGRAFLRAREAWGAPTGTQAHTWHQCPHARGGGRTGLLRVPQMPAPAATDQGGRDAGWGRPGVGCAAARPSRGRGPPHRVKTVLSLGGPNAPPKRARKTQWGRTGKTAWPAGPGPQGSGAAGPPLRPVAWCASGQAKVRSKASPSLPKAVPAPRSGPDVAALRQSVTSIRLLTFPSCR